MDVLKTLENVRTHLTDVEIDGLSDVDVLDDSLKIIEDAKAVYRARDRAAAPEDLDAPTVPRETPRVGSLAWYDAIGVDAPIVPPRRRPTNTDLVVHVTYPDGETTTYHGRDADTPDALGVLVALHEASWLRWPPSWTRLRETGMEWTAAQARAWWPR